MVVNFSFIMQKGAYLFSKEMSRNTKKSAYHLAFEGEDMVSFCHECSRTIYAGTACLLGTGVGAIFLDG